MMREIFKSTRRAGLGGLVVAVLTFVTTYERMSSSTHPPLFEAAVISLLVLTSVVLVLGVGLGIIDYTDTHGKG